MADARNILYVLATSIPGLFILGLFKLGLMKSGLLESGLLKSVLLIPGLLILPAVIMPASAASDFPVAPSDASAATASGLQQLDTAALRKTFTGTHVEQDARGQVYRAQYGADGSVILSNSSGLIDRGTFTVIRQHGGGVCLRLEHQMNQRMCAIWFFADDGVHLFGYSPTDGTLRAVSRPGAD